MITILSFKQVMEKFNFTSKGFKSIIFSFVSVLLFNIPILKLQPTIKIFIVVFSVIQHKYARCLIYRPLDISSLFSTKFKQS